MTPEQEAAARRMKWWLDHRARSKGESPAAKVALGRPEFYERPEDRPDLPPPAEDHDWPEVEPRVAGEFSHTKGRPTGG